MGNSFRQQPLPTLYGENKTPVSEDLLEVGLLVAFGMLAFSFMLIIPGIRGWERIFATIRVFAALWIGAVILVCNFGYGWYTDTVRVQTQYKAFTTEEITADVGLHIGLRGINITLKGEALDPNGVLAGETIDYNEQFWWADPWAQGRIGFGRYAGRLNQEFRAAQYRGMPYPILWVAEYFTLDGEQIRWGRKFRQAGWYAHQFLWLSFAVYLLDIAIFIFNVRIGIHFLMLLGTLMICSCFAFGMIIMNDPPLVLPWNQAGCHPNPSNNEWCALRLEPTYGWSFYLVLFTAIATFFTGVILFIIDFFRPRWTTAWFHHSIIEEDDEFIIDESASGDLEETEAALEGGRTRVSYRRGGGRTTRGRQTIAKYRQTTRRPRSTLKGERVASSEIPLTDIKS